MSLKNCFLEKQIVRRASRCSRVRRVRCFRSRRCIGALSSWCCAAGKQAAYAPQASVSHCATTPPASVSRASKRRNVAWVRRPKTNATTSPVLAFSTHHNQRCSFLRRTNDHISSAHRRKRATAEADRKGARWFTASIFFSSPITVCGLMPRTHAVSRTPLPFRAMSVIRCRAPGSWILCWYRS